MAAVDLPSFDDAFAKAEADLLSTSTVPELPDLFDVPELPQLVSEEVADEPAIEAPDDLPEQEVDEGRLKQTMMI